MSMTCMIMTHGVLMTVAMTTIGTGCCLSLITIMALIGSLVIRTCCFTGPVTVKWLCIEPSTSCTGLLHATLIACSCELGVMRRVQGTKMHVVMEHLEGRRLTASNKSIAVEDLGNVK